MNDLYLREVRLKPGQTAPPFLKNVFPLYFTQPITIIAGENGSGKSTLLESIALKLGCNAEGGGRNFVFKTEDTHSDFHQRLTLSRGHRREKDVFFYRAETFYNLNTEIRRLDGEGSFDPEVKSYYGGRDLHSISHGEAMESLFTHRFKPNGLYVLDEPEASLSPQRQLSFIIRVVELANRGAQFLIATHSPLIMSIPNAQLLQISDSKLESIEPEDSDAFSIYRAVINSSGRYLAELVVDT